MKQLRYLWIFIVLSSCISSDISTLNIIPIDIEANPELPFSHYFEFSKFVKLETSEQSVVSNIRKIVDTGEQIFILTWGKSQILIFDSNGKYKSKIDKNGKGPEEYIYVVDFDIDVDAQLICLYDKQLKAFIYYDFTGVFVKKVNTELDLETFSLRPDGTMLGFSFLNRTIQFNEKSYRLWMLDSHGKVISGYLPIQASQLGGSMGLGSSFYKTASETFFIPFIGDTMYNIQHNSKDLMPVFFFDFGENVFKGDILNQNKRDLIKSLNESCIVHGEFIGRSKNLVNYYNFRDRSIGVILKGTVLIDQDKNTSSTFEGDSLFDEANELPLRFGHQQTSADQLIAIVQPFDLLESQYSNNKSIGHKLSMDADEDDNPILVYYNETIK